MALEMSVDDGVGHVDGGVQSPLVQDDVNTVADVMFLTTSASASRSPASAAWNAMFESLVLPAIFSCSNVLLSAATPIIDRTSRNISAGNSDIPDWRVPQHADGEKLAHDGHGTRLRTVITDESADRMRRSVGVVVVPAKA